MARYKRIEVLSAMYETGVVPVFYHPDIQVVKQVVKACADGGARLIEFTNRGDFAYRVFSELEEYCAKELPEMITGIGSIVDAPTAALYINNATNFVVGPNLNEDVAKICNRRKIAYSPGCGSVTEISKAEELGCDIVKVFPGGQVGGPAFVKGVKGPMPWASLMPTGGVDTTEESLKEWFDAGIVCAGMGSKLITKELLASKDYVGISKKVQKVIQIVANLKENNS